jgi:hypothetical protein
MLAGAVLGAALIRHAQAYDPLIIALVVIIVGAAVTYTLGKPDPAWVATPAATGPGRTWNRTSGSRTGPDTLLGRAGLVDGVGVEDRRAGRRLEQRDLGPVQVAADIADGDHRDLVRLDEPQVVMAARRRTSQMVAAMSSTDSASSQPPSIHWNGQNRLAGW